MFDLTLQDFNGEPRALDLDIAEALGFERSRKIRELIERYIDELLGFGICPTVEQIHKGAGRPGKEYWLNEKQALFICTRSDAKNAIDITIQMVEVFTAWKAGKLAAPAAVNLPVDADTWRGLIREARLLFGRQAAVELWLKSPLPSVPIPLPPTTSIADLSHVYTFLDECCAVTGDPNDFILSSELVAALGRWLVEGGFPLWSETLRRRALRRASLDYRSPGGSARFERRKRSRNGYVGIILSSSDG